MLIWEKRSESVRMREFLKGEKMKIIFVGAGSAFNKKDGQSNVLVKSKSNKYLLIDCGSYCWDFMSKINLCVNDIDALYVSHLHGDHIGGIEELAFCTYFNPSCERPKLFCNNSLMHDLWDQSLRGGLESIQGKVVTITEYFDCHPVEKNDSFDWEGIRFTPVQTVHVMAGYYIKYSYGLCIQEKGGKSIFFTSDTQFCPNQIMYFYDKADVIFQDCETAPYNSGVHASYNELKTLEDSIKEKMILYHYQPNPPQDYIADGFAGMAKAGKVYEF